MKKIYSQRNRLKFNPDSCGRVICCAECAGNGCFQNSTTLFSEIEQTTRIEISKLCQRNPPEEKAETIMKVEQRDVENITSNLCGLSVKTSRFKGALSGLKQFLATKNPLKVMKNPFYFM